MNRAETARLLGFCAANDQRTVGEADVLAWHDMLGPIAFARAWEAARAHYRRQPDVRLKPGHLWQLCKTTTTAEAAQRDLEQPCEHGSICRSCKSVHHSTEPCAVLTPGPEAIARALAGARSLAELNPPPATA